MTAHAGKENNKTKREKNFFFFLFCVKQNMNYDLSWTAINFVKYTIILLGYIKSRIN